MRARLDVVLAGAGGEIERFQALSTCERKEKGKDYLAGRDLTNVCLKS